MHYDCIVLMKNVDHFDIIITGFLSKIMGYCIRVWVEAGVLSIAIILLFLLLLLVGLLSFFTLPILVLSSKDLRLRFLKLNVMCYQSIRKPPQYLMHLASAILIVVFQLLAYTTNFSLLRLQLQNIELTLPRSFICHKLTIVLLTFV